MKLRSLAFAFAFILLTFLGLKSKAATPSTADKASATYEATH
ncbi:hypothetical protein R9C00_29245 [Flammeovirgaceae bacterium SG7u.111]|nr:hypothetical protein [Flammeovirgaceae bacterium SG7u.132]WPO35786.1 hypothetical protein R9C00_29245 [Flammeovirgaceae bacterium SG7u.111]